MHFSVFNIIQVVIFLVSLTVFIQKSSPFYLKLFPVYFLCGLLVGMVMEWLANHNKYNTGVANVWGIIEFCFYFFVLHEIITNPKVKRVILTVVFIYPTFSVIMLYFQKQVGFNTVNFTIGTLTTVLLCIYYFVELFQKAETQSLARLPDFWITTAILFNNVLGFPTFAFISFIKNTPKLISDNINAIFYIINLLTAILYSIGFLCRIRIKKSSL